MDQIPLLFMSDVLFSVGVKNVAELSKAEHSWGSAACEISQKQKYTDVEINSARQFQKISVRTKFGYEPFVKNDKYIAGTKIEVEWSEMSFDNTEPLELNSRLLSATSAHLLGPESMLFVRKVNRENGGFSMDPFFNSLAGPFKKIYFFDCQGYAPEIERILAVSLVPGCTREVCIQFSDITAKSLEILLKFAKVSLELPRNLRPEIKIRSCSEAATEQQVVEFLEYCRENDRYLKLNLSWAELDRRQLSEIVQRLQRNNWAVERKWMREEERESFCSMYLKIHFCLFHGRSFSHEMLQDREWAVLEYRIFNESREQICSVHKRYPIELQLEALR
ncbi:hypothetical protein L596_001703 [Steinernema carpocapsae]|uniref:Uncharacterized protein n=1 Tax=Steinernema carpocapsae TaxID=34508 RepID=A0A4U8UM94_STECR|nr:hypothetical protein L596_001703 [Steinernema carpocapsae]